MKLAFAFAFAAAACDGELHEDVPDVPGADSQAAAVPAAAASSVTFHFDVDIQKDVDALTCSQSTCHGASGGAGGMKLTKDATGALLTANFEALKQRATKGEQSLVLLKATAETAHSGGARFAKGDATYGRWLTWIKEGTPR